MALQIGRQLFLVIALRGHALQGRAVRALFWFGMSAVPWIAGGLTHGTARAVLWAVAVSVDWTAHRLGWPTPGFGRAPTFELPVASEHLAERHRQFLIIALGELILVTGLAFSRGGFAPNRTAALVVSFATTVLLWRIYIYRAGEMLAAAMKAAGDPNRLGLEATHVHVVMVVGIVATGVGDELVIDHPLGHTQPAWIAVILGGPALFVAGRAGFEYVVFRRVSPDRPIGLLVLAALAPVMLHVPPLLAAIAVTAVLAGIAVADAARARGRPPEPPLPAGGPS